MALPYPCHTEEESVNSPVALWAVSSFTGELKSKLWCFSLLSLYHTFEVLCRDRSLSLALLPAEVFFVLIIPG